jgi:E3 ubiquitin-protein ligase DOA10
MKHIHFVIYRLKSIIIIYFIVTLFIYLEIKFIKPLNDVKIERATITFTKDEKDRTVFINKMINSGIMKMFIFLFYNFYIYIFYFVSEVLCICTNDDDYFSIRNIFFYCNDFIFLLFNNLMRNRNCIWIETI